MTDRRRRILLVLLHAGLLRHYSGPVAELAKRGHDVHIALVRGDEKHEGDDLLVQRLRDDYPERVTSSVAPVRPYDDGWRRLAFFVRALIDVARYADPDYRNAHALRQRIITRTTQRLDMTRLPESFKRRFRDAVAWFARPSSEEGAARRVKRLTTIEDAIPSSPLITRYIANLKPDVVLASPVVEFASNQVEYLKSARDLSIRTGVCIASWDNLTNKGLIRFRPNRVFVWNETQRGEATRYDGVPPERAVATGAPRFDPWFARTPSVSRDDFLERLGLDPSRPLLLYLCSSSFVAPEETAFVRRWLKAVRDAEDRTLSGANILVRPHPQNSKIWDDVELHDERSVVWPKGGLHPDEGVAQAAYYDSMAHSTLVVGINTSALIESGIVGKSVYTVLDGDFELTQSGTLHFHYLRAENGGFVHTASDLKTHLGQIANALNAGSADEDMVQAFIRKFVRPRGLDRTAASVLADEIEALAASGEPAAKGLLPGARLVRVALAPLAAATTLAAHLFDNRTRA